MPPRWDVADDNGADSGILHHDPPAFGDPRLPELPPVPSRWNVFDDFRAGSGVLHHHGPCSNGAVGFVRAETVVAHSGGEIRQRHTVGPTIQGPTMVAKADSLDRKPTT